MIDITIHDADGRPIQTMTLLDTGEADQNAGLTHGWVEGIADLRRGMVDIRSKEHLPRPTLPTWPAQMQAPATLDMDLLPTGATVTATNEAGEAVATDDPADPITLTGAGDIYRVTVAAPWPWIALDQTIEVT
ncbi:MAG: hypothetical protein RQ750_12235 [Roseovarius sp.]|nr:hypothetical protein [Roseovarius sp.]